MNCINLPFLKIQLLDTNCVLLVGRFQVKIKGKVRFYPKTAFFERKIAAAQ
jgi:hypothetical protein